MSFPAVAYKTSSYLWPHLKCPWPQFIRKSSFFSCWGVGSLKSHRHFQNVTCRDQTALLTKKIPLSEYHPQLYWIGLIRVDGVLELREDCEKKPHKILTSLSSADWNICCTKNDSKSKEDDLIKTFFCSMQVWS